MEVELPIAPECVPHNKRATCAGSLDEVMDACTGMIRCECEMKMDFFFGNLFLVNDTNRRFWRTFGM